MPAATTIAVSPPIRYDVLVDRVRGGGQRKLATICAVSLRHALEQLADHPTLKRLDLMPERAAINNAIDSYVNLLGCQLDSAVAFLPGAALRRVWVDPYPYLPLAPYDGALVEHHTPRAALRAAFAELRRAKVGARMQVPESKEPYLPDDAPLVYTRSVAAAVLDQRPGSPTQPGQSASFYVYYRAGSGADPLARRAVGMRAMHALQHHGLHVEWDGNPGHSLEVVALDRDAVRAWQQRLDATRAAGANATMLAAAASRGQRPVQMLLDD